MRVCCFLRALSLMTASEKVTVSRSGLEGEGEGAPPAATAADAEGEGDAALCAVVW